MYKDKDCDICHGEGTTSTWDGESDYCLCVRENKAEADGERLFENEYQN